MLRFLSIINILVGAAVLLLLIWIFYEDVTSVGISRQDIIIFLFFLLPSLAPIWFSSFTIKYISLNESIAETDILDIQFVPSKTERGRISFFTTLCGIITFLDGLAVVGLTIYLLTLILNAYPDRLDLSSLLIRLGLLTLFLFAASSLIVFPIRMIKKVSYK